MNVQFETKAIVFDLMGVLLVKREGYVPDEIVDKVDNLIGTNVNDESLRREAADRYGLSGKEFDDILERCAGKYERHESLWEMLPELRKSYGLAIINNGTALTLEYLDKRYAIRDSFDLFVSSAIEGVRKPDPEIFIRTAGRLGVRPEECLFLDDLEENVQGAEKAGMKTIWWKDQHSGFGEFRKFIDGEMEKTC